VAATAQPRGANRLSCPAFGCNFVAVNGVNSQLDLLMKQRADILGGIEMMINPKLFVVEPIHRAQDLNPQRDFFRTPSILGRVY